MFKDSKDQPNGHKSSSKTTGDQEGITDALEDFFTDIQYTQYNLIYSFAMYLDLWLIQTILLLVGIRMTPFICKDRLQFGKVSGCQ